MAGDVLGPVGADQEDADASGCDRVVQRGDERAGSSTRVRAMPCSAQRASRSTPWGVPNSCSKRAASSSAGLGQEREDPATVVVEQHVRGVDAAAGGAEQAVGVVQEREVAEDADDGWVTRVASRRESEHGRHRAVDAVGAPVRDDTRRPVRGAMQYSSSRTGMLDATNSMASSGSAAATSRATRPSNGACRIRRGRRRVRSRARFSASSQASATRDRRRR